MKTQVIKITAASMFGGELIPVDDLIEVTEREARDLIARGRAVLHDVEDAIDSAEVMIDDVKQVVKAGRKAKA